jgi:hypothetical protein
MPDTSPPWRPLLPAASLLAVLALGATLAAACGGSNDNGGKSNVEPPAAAYQDYFANLGPVVAALDQRIPQLDTSGTDAPALAASLRSYDDALNAFADGLDKIDAPGKARGTHETWAASSRDIVKTFDKLADTLANPSHTATQDELTLSAGGSGGIILWVAACITLQDLARDKGVTLDFKCTTTLGFGGPVTRRSAGTTVQRWE